MSRSWKIRVLLAAVQLGRDFRPAELGLSSLANTVGAVQSLVEAGELEWLRGDGSCQWTYRLTATGTARAKLHASGVTPRRSLRHG